MAYNSYFPAGYQPVYYQPSYQPQQVQPATAQQAPSQSNGGGLTWVQGEAGAKSYLVAPNTTVMLMDSESDVFYLKSTDASGMPMPLRIFEYKERKTADLDDRLIARDNSSAYVTKREFEAFKGQIEASLREGRGGVKGGEPDGE